MTPGYFRKPEATAALTLPGGWLDSGDLAYLADGEVHIAGRKKDLIIKAGRNLVPQEIEEVASQVAGIRRGCVAAFGVTQAAQGTEGLVVVAETRLRETARRDKVIGAITEAVANAVGTPPDLVVLVPPGAVPKTSSGKIRRAATKDAYLAGELGAPPAMSLGARFRLASAALRDRVEPRIRSGLRVLYALYLVLVLGGAALLLWPVIALARGRRAARMLERVYVRFALRAAGCRLHVEGVENLRGAGPFLLASNHTSYVDIALLLALLPMHFVFVSKKEVASWPFVGLFIRKAGHLTVDREDAQESVAAAGKVARAVEEGESVLVFPEATFTAASGLRPFRLGIFKTAVETGTAVVPLAVRGARRALRDGTMLPRPGPLHLWIGDPIAPQGEGWRAVVRLRDQVAEAIAAHCGEPRLDMVAGAHERP
jgi:1-acyl-sn-glycerol-3-phosphate acyltransferase